MPTKGIYIHVSELVLGFVDKTEDFSNVECASNKSELDNPNCGKTNTGLNILTNEDVV